jgi:tryptophanyl-tRNA synthetase
MTQPKLFKKGEVNFIRIDLGKEYYEGGIYPHLFPETILDYMGCIKKAMENYTTPTQSIHGIINRPNIEGFISSYDILIKCNNDVMNFETKIIIPLKNYKKEQIDYINEQFEEIKQKLENSEKRIALLEEYINKK